MSRKTLLTETEIRQFLKLANLGAVGDTRIQEMFGTDELSEEEEEMEMDMELGAEEEPMDDMGAPAEMEPDLDTGADMEAPAADAGGQMVSVDDFMGALESALEDALGEPVEVDMDDDAGAADDDAEIDMDDPAGDMDMDMGLDDGGDDEEEPGMRDIYESQDDLVKEVARRVAVRLQEKNNKQQVIDQLAERIMKRLAQ